jgi:ribosomal protein S18 acetylase RimI-like enzyme
MLDDRLREAGARDLIVGALSGNVDAQRLYRRHGFQATWLYLSRMEGRESP